MTRIGMVSGLDPVLLHTKEGSHCYMTHTDFPKITPQHTLLSVISCQRVIVVLLA